MTELIRVIDASESGRLTEIGEMTALAYLADGLIEANHPYATILRDAQARAQQATLLAMLDGDGGEGAVVGTLTVVPAGTPFAELAQDGEYELRMLAVNPIERGRGIGEKLTRAGMEMAVAAGASRVVLSTMESMHAAHRIYERLGFTRREDLDWTVADGGEANASRLTPGQFPTEPARAVQGMRLWGYSWQP